MSEDFFWKRGIKRTANNGASESGCGGLRLSQSVWQGFNDASAHVK